ncbi:MAG: AzlC family protein [Actinomycetia bacterium]|nr:AzlC family protein [Actinomycetes bacterium]
MDRTSVIRASIAVGAATGAYGISFGAVSVAAGLSVAQTCALSLLMFTGGSQFALVGVLGAGGGTAAAVAAAVGLGSRNAFYGLRISPILGLRWPRKALAAQLVIDESAAMASAQPTPELGRTGFWATGLAVFVLWNLGTLAGAAGATAVPDPRVLGLDAAAPAAFLALLARQVRGRRAWVVTLLAAVIALASAPFVPAGVPILLAAGAAGLGLLGPPARLGLPRRGAPDRSDP